jgi:hypothetical protein
MLASGLAQDLPLPPGELGLEVCVTAVAFELRRIGMGHHPAATVAGEALHLFAAQAPARLVLGGGEEVVGLSYEDAARVWLPGRHHPVAGRPGPMAS